MGYIAFDFDKTIAVRNSGDSIFKFGEPIPKTIEFIKFLQSKKRKVRIITARSEKQFAAIKTWLAKQGITDVEVSNTKTSAMDILFDDKGVGIIANEGVTHIEMLARADEFLRDWFLGINIDQKLVEEWLAKYNKVRQQYDKDLGL